MCFTVCFRFTFLKQYANIFRQVIPVKSWWVTRQFIVYVLGWPVSFSSSSCSQSRSTAAKAAVRTFIMGKLDGGHLVVAEYPLC